jgi:hypothetical protein
MASWSFIEEHAHRVSISEEQAVPPVFLAADPLWLHGASLKSMLIERVSVKSKQS